jgi:hypothetical protein
LPSSTLKYAAAGALGTGLGVVHQQCLLVIAEGGDHLRMPEELVERLRESLVGARAFEPTGRGIADDVVGSRRCDEDVGPVSRLVSSRLASPGQTTFFVPEFVPE